MERGCQVGYTVDFWVCAAGSYRRHRSGECDCVQITIRSTSSRLTWSPRRSYSPVVRADSWLAMA